jgi:hypothetical protein
MIVRTFYQTNYYYFIKSLNARFLLIIIYLDLSLSSTHKISLVIQPLGSHSAPTGVDSVEYSFILGEPFMKFQKYPDDLCLS